MNTDQERGDRFAGKHGEMTDVVLRVFYEFDNELGGGFLQSVYHAAFKLALRQAGLQVESQVAVPVYFPRRGRRGLSRRLDCQCGCLARVEGPESIGADPRGPNTSLSESDPIGGWHAFQLRP